MRNGTFRTFGLVPAASLTLVLAKRQSHIPDTGFGGALLRAGRLQANEMPGTISEAELAEAMAEMEALRQEHRDLDAAIDALQQVGAPDQLQIQRLKKRKLVLRDRLSRLEDLVTPDIIA